VVQLMNITTTKEPVCLGKTEDAQNGT